MTSDREVRRRGPFKIFCWGASNILIWAMTGMVMGRLAAWTVSLWAGDNENWGPSDIIVGLLLCVLYIAIPLAMQWYATQETEPTEAQEEADPCSSGS